MVFRSVDHLAELEREISLRRREADRIRERLKERGPGEYCGAQYRAIVREFDRLALDTQVVKGLLTPAQLLEATVPRHQVQLTVRPIGGKS